MPTIVLKQRGRTAPVESSTAGNERRFDVDTFEALALPCLPEVARFARSLTRDRADADDLVQETYLRAFRHWRTFAGADPRRWLFTICRNTFSRAHRRRARVLLTAEGDVDALFSATARIRACDVTDAGIASGDVDVGEAIERAIASLQAPQRSVLVLVDVEGFSYDEAAAALDVPVGTVRSRLFRARRSLQNALIEHARDAGIERPAGTSDSSTVSRT